MLAHNASFVATIFILPEAARFLPIGFPQIHRYVAAYYWFLYRDIKDYMPLECRCFAPSMPKEENKSAP